MVFNDWDVSPRSGMHAGGIERLLVDQGEGIVVTSDHLGVVKNKEEIKDKHSKLIRKRNKIVTNR